MTKDRTKGTGKKCPPGCACGKHSNNQRPWQKGRKLSAEHKEKLRQANLGRKMPEAEKRKMSETKRRRARRIQEEMPYVLPKRKKCTVCGKTKNVETGFSLRKIKLKSGFERMGVEPRCKKCVAAATKAWREKKREEGTLSEIQKRYRENLSEEQREQRREYNREYQTIKRREKGAKPRGARRPGKEPKVDRMPVVNFMLEEMEERGIARDQVAQRGGISNGRIKYIIEGEEPSSKTKNGKVTIDKISLGMVDRILRGLDREWMLTILYPDEVVNAAN